MRVLVSVLIWASLSSLLLNVSGCASVGVAQDAKGTGVKRIYQKPVSEAWRAMRNAVVSTGGVIKEEDKEDCSVLSEYGVSWFSWGERVGVFCRAVTPTQTEIEIVSKPAVSTNVTATDWTSAIFRQLDSHLK